MDAVEAALSEVLPPGVTARATPRARVGIPRPMPNPRYDSVLQAVGVDPDRYPRNGRVAVDIQVGYWRKANQIHAWFEQEHELENDEDVLVSREELARLRDDCRRVLDDHGLAETVLPTRSGFFFGDTEYDDWYFRDLEDTIVILDRVLTDPALVTADLYYKGWW